MSSQYLARMTAEQVRAACARTIRWVSEARGYRGPGIVPAFARGTLDHRAILYVDGGLTSH